MRPEALRSTSEFTQELMNRDPRIGRALSGIRTYFELLKDPPWHDGLSSAGHASNIQICALRSIDKISRSKRLRQPSDSYQSLLQDFLRSWGGKVIIMRHGAQQLDSETQDLQGAAQKIRMMQPRHNQDDPLTSLSIAETAGTAYLMNIIQETTGKSIEVESSENLRAAQVAGIIAEVANAPVSYNPDLSCIDYPDNISDEELNKLLGGENNGTLPLSRNTINFVSGDGTYEAITESVTGLILRGISSSRDQIILAVTHAQQYAAAVQIARNFTDVNRERPDELGFLVFSQGKALEFPNGFYQAAA